MHENMKRIAYNASDKICHIERGSDCGIIEALRKVI